MTDADNPLPFDRVPLGPPPLPRMDAVPLPKVDDLPPLPALPPPRVKVDPPPAPKPKPEPKPAPKTEPTPTPVAATPVPKPRPLADTARDLFRPTRKAGAALVAAASVVAGVGGVYLTNRTAPKPPAETTPSAMASVAPRPKAGEDIKPVLVDAPPAKPSDQELPPVNLPPGAGSATAFTSPTASAMLPIPSIEPPPSGPAQNPPRELNLSAPSVVAIPLPTPPSVSLVAPARPTEIVHAGGQTPPATSAPAVPAAPKPDLPPVPGVTPPAPPVVTVPADKTELPLPKVEVAPADKPKDTPAVSATGGSPVVPLPLSTPPTIPAPTAPASGEAKPFSLPLPNTDTVAPAAPLTLPAAPNLSKPAVLPPGAPDATPKLSPPASFPTTTPPAAPSAAKTEPLPGFSFVTEPAAPATPPAVQPAPPAALPPAPTVNPTATAPAPAAPLVNVPPSAPSRPSVTFLAPPVGPAGVSLVKPAGATDVKTDFDVDLHDPKPADTYESISKLYYGDTRYAGALRAFNRNQPLGGGRSVEVPPAAELKKRYGGGSDRPVRSPGQP